MNSGEIGALIPIVAIVMGIGVAIASIITKSRERIAALEQRHKERLAAIEKGIELPPELAPGEDEANSRNPSRSLLGGLVCLGIGVALGVSSFIIEVRELLLPATILLAIGAALSIYYLIAVRKVAAPPDSR